MSVKKSARKAPPPPARPAFPWMALALALVTLAVFCPVARFQFLQFDDPAFVTDNPQVQAGLTAEGLKWAWRNEVAGNWHPITMLTHMLDCQLFGVQPWWPHLVNVLLHAANAVLLFGLFKRMTGAFWRSAAVAALFALHPLHVESVAWVSERKDVLSTLFWFLTTWAYVRYAEKQWRVASGQWTVFYGLSLLFFALGLMSKPMLVTVPCTLLLLDYWPLGRLKAGTSVWRLVAEKIPFLAMSAALCVVTFRLQEKIGAVPQAQVLPIGKRLGNALLSYVGYIEMMFWPRHLAGLYLVRLGAWPWREVALAALAALLLLAVSGLVVAQGRRRPWLAVGWFWYLGTLVPVIGLVQVGNQAMADRYTYVPLIGLFVMLAWGGWELAGAWRLGRFAPAAMAVALSACAVLTVRQEFYWKNTETFYKRVLEEKPDNYIAHNNLGIYYDETSRTNEALAHLIAAVQANPKYAGARYNLGSLYIRINRPEEAISNLLAAIREKPDYAEAHNNLGSLFLDQKRYGEAIQHFRAAASLRPECKFYFNLGNALTEEAGVRHDTDESAEAARIFQQALQVAPGSSDARHNLGVAWQKLGLLCASQKKMPEAERAFRELIGLQTNNADAHRWLGNALMLQNKPGEAIPFYVTAARLNPGDWESECNLAHALLRQGKRDEAVEHYRQSLRINPNYTEAQTALRQLQNPPNAPQKPESVIK